jgi:YbgC/YbaW family acyl-CoA thioester hydrolase
MAESREAKSVIHEFVARQRELYGGGGLAGVGELLAEDVVWHVPGTSPIAGDYRGREAVLGYFLARRALAGGRIEIFRNDELVNGDVVVQLADGRARLGEWRTAGVYRVAGGRIAEAWLVPLDLDAFDDAWGAARPRPFVHAQRVRPQDCAASTMLGHPRLLEFLEAAFVELWRSRLGSLEESLGRDRSLTLRAIAVDYLAPVRVDDSLRVEVSVDRVTGRSLRLNYSSYVDDALVAGARSTYVCLDRASGSPAAWPEHVADALARQS